MKMVGGGEDNRWSNTSPAAMELVSSRFGADSKLYDAVPTLIRKFGGIQRMQLEIRYELPWGVPAIATLGSNSSVGTGSSHHLAAISAGHAGYLYATGRPTMATRTCAWNEQLSADKTGLLTHGAVALMRVGRNRQASAGQHCQEVRRGVAPEDLAGENVFRVDASVTIEKCTQSCSGVSTCRALFFKLGSGSEWDTPSDRLGSCYLLTALPYVSRWVSDPTDVVSGIVAECQATTDYTSTHYGDGVGSRPEIITLRTIMPLFATKTVATSTSPDWVSLLQ